MTPDEIAREIVFKWMAGRSNEWEPLSLAIAAAIRAERERAEKAGAELLTVLQREGATTERNDARLDQLEAERDRLRDALRSIAANTCCDGCREAALVARAALRKTDVSPIGGDPVNNQGA